MPATEPRTGRWKGRGACAPRPFLSRATVTIAVAVRVASSRGCRSPLPSVDRDRQTHLNRVGADGLVERHAHSTDRRRISLKLTAAGKAFIAKLIPAYAPRLSAVANGLSEKERRQFLRLLDKIQVGLETLRAPGKDRVLA